MDENDYLSEQLPIPDDFNILEEPVDVFLQFEYLEQARNPKRRKIPFNDLEEAEAILMAKDTTPATKKKLMIQLAETDNVESFRLLERFKSKARGKLKQWTILALHESRMHIQTSLLGERQVFVSTGLGGKGKNVRFFFILKKREESEFTETQRRLVETELNYSFKNSNGEFEKIQFEDNFATGLFLYPLKEDFQPVFRAFIEECNQYGNFLYEGVIITNMKEFSVAEIKAFYPFTEATDNH
ncbi:MAG: hypothetical protein LBR06_02360 [Bacteroidales bacterium]|jgi:hypothetical protein|nr:hypothetical protein [Bacteroidales bacterium]